MTDTLTPLILAVVEWIAMKPQPYFEVMDAWRTSCPRLPVWEEANDRGFLVQRDVTNQESVVDVTPRGHRFLQENGRPPNV